MYLKSRKLFPRKKSWVFSKVQSFQETLRLYLVLEKLKGKCGEKK